MVVQLDAPRLSDEDIAPLREGVRGAVIHPDEGAYDEARRVWNGMIEREPALIVQCAGAADVMTAVRFAVDRGLPVAVRGGGHNVAGTAVADGALVVDLSPMKGIRVDPTARTVWAEGGVKWAELDQETAAFGLATTGGTVSMTGIGGLTLGGGLGWLMRAHGLTCDNLLAADIVTADGRMLTVSETEHADLFWAIRGGGGNFGVVTAFKFQLHPVPATIMAGPIFYPLDAGGEVLRMYRDVAPTLPDEAICHLGMLTSPEGVKMIALLPAYIGSLEAGAEALKPLRGFGTPAADLHGPMPYRTLQTIFDAGFPAGVRNYWKAGLLQALTDEAIDAFVATFAQAPSPRNLVLIEQLGGAVARKGSGDTAFAHRDSPYSVIIASAWEDPADDQANIAWTRSLWAVLEPLSPGGVYVNYLSAPELEGANRVRAAYGPNYDRLAAIKRTYDPGNHFRSNQNIIPTA